MALSDYTLAWSHPSNNQIADDAVNLLNQDGKHPDSLSHICHNGHINYWLLHSLPRTMGFKLLKITVQFSDLTTISSLFPEFSSLVCRICFPTRISCTELFQWTIICSLACLIGLFILACLMRMLHSSCLLNIGFLSLASYESAEF